MSIGLPINPGDALQLSYLFEDGKTTFYVRAIVYDVNDVEVPSSPFDLAHLANGYFSNLDCVPPNGLYKAIYIVYEDSGYTIKSTRYSQEEDMFIVGLQTSVDYEGIADAVWDELNICTEHNLATSAGFLLCSIKAIVADTNWKINNYLLPLLALLQQVNDRVEATSIAKAVWNALRSSYQIVGSFGEALQGVITVSRANLLDNLTRLDVVVSTRAGQVTVDQILYDTNILNDKLTNIRAGKIDLIDVVLSTRASQASMDLKPNSDQISNAVWDEAIGDHLGPDTTGEALYQGSTPYPTPLAIADAVWDEAGAGHMLPGSFGSRLDVPVSTRADDTDVTNIRSDIESVQDVVDILPTVVGDATLAKQNDILSELSTKADQSTAMATLIRANIIPSNPLLTTDSRLNRIDINISSRATPSDIETIKGAGWSSSTDTLEKIRDAIPAPCDISSVLASLDEIKGTGFSPADSLHEISQTSTDAKLSAEDSAAAALAAFNAIATKAEQFTVDLILSAIGDIPTNPVLTSDSRLGRLDANISTRASQVSVDEMKSVSFNANTHNLKNIYDTIVSADHSTEIINLLNIINNQIPDVALQSTLIDVAAAVDNIPIDTLRINDPRLAYLDAAITSRLASSDFNIIKGAGYDVANDSLFAISQKINGVCTLSDINSIVVELSKIEGTGFSTFADSLKAANDKAIADRNVLKADLTALLSEGEGF